MQLKETIVEGLKDGKAKDVVCIDMRNDSVVHKKTMIYFFCLGTLCESTGMLSLWRVYQPYKLQMCRGKTVNWPSVKIRVADPKF